MARERHNIPARERIIKPFIDKDFPDWSGEIRYFVNMPLSAVHKLIKKGFLRKDETQNYSPTAKEFFNFMRKWKKYDIRAHGYEISASRSDVRVTIEGLMHSNRQALNDPEFLKEWFLFNRGADELDERRSWWD